MTVAACVHSAPPAFSSYAPSLEHLLRDDSGQDMIEYALVAATIGLGTVAGVNGLASQVANYLGIVDAGFDHSLAGHI